MKGLGYAQRTILPLLGDHPVPTGYLIRRSGIADRVVDRALAGLQRRGLAERVSYGQWKAAA